MQGRVRVQLFQLCVYPHAQAPASEELVPRVVGCNTFLSKIIPFHTTSAGARMGGSGDMLSEDSHLVNLLPREFPGMLDPEVTHVLHWTAVNPSPSELCGDVLFNTGCGVQVDRRCQETVSPYVE